MSEKNKRLLLVGTLKKNSKNIWTHNPRFFFLNTEEHIGGFDELC